jgi:hypothetical protein
LGDIADDFHASIVIHHRGRGAGCKGLNWTMSRDSARGNRKQETGNREKISVGKALFPYGCGRLLGIRDWALHLPLYIFHGLFHFENCCFPSNNLSPILANDVK